MHDVTAIAAPQIQPAVGKNSNPRYTELYRRYPTIDYLRRAARHKLPHFAFEYGNGGSGKDDAGIRRNWAALDAIELLPRYGVMPSLPPCDVELFGRRYAAPTGVAPMGSPAIVWPGADRHFARAVMMDSGIRSGTDVVRAYALGAAAFAGKAFLWGLGALGEEGPGHVIDLLIEETQAALGQLGARKPDEVRTFEIRYTAALQF
ncbi:MAG TPA: alpha-hydroxy-acid oxidizing protein [Xanthobacteraceae bacterium]|nr:alpha-hydroxy-acid oxidizing protein [Xanthobacteraceae bacterium]